MTFFDYLETSFTAANQSMATGNPNDVTVPRQAKVNAALALVGMSRTFIKWVYVGTILGSYILIKLHIKKAPVFLSSIPGQVPAGTPSLSVVPAQPTPEPPKTA